MKFKKITTLIFAVTLLLISSCKKKEIFVDPAYIFLKWSSAVKNLNYKEYSECEAFPKDESVFREIYGDFYLSDLIIRDLGKFNEKDTKIDAAGYEYKFRSVYFECVRIMRKTGRPAQNMKGDVEFINYIYGPKKDKGWLMFNRTIINTDMVNAQ
ncbi:MAG: hypothetical protein FWH53_09870 [Leptospirales bacterium]|nr:hypothetical protein [Leptospirales bacterium]